MSKVIHNITKLYSVKVTTIIKPTSLDDIRKAILSSTLPISIGGGYFSMGGQVAYEDSLHIDMRAMNKIIAYHPEEHWITVQAGIRWRDIQEQIDKDDLAIRIMQTYANFTVGGSLNVNAHGRYVCQGPLIHSIKSFKIMLANGEVVFASPIENADLYFGAIGSYGALGIIVEVTLNLVPNTKVEREEFKINVKDYKQYFFENIRENKKAVFHNADLYPPHYTKARTITWFETDKPLTRKVRVEKTKFYYGLERYFIWAIMSTPFGKWRREYIIDPILYLKPKITWRNAEASGYDVKELEPWSRKRVTDVLQEYFVPVQQFDTFLPMMAKILKRYHVNALNISVRHANKDPGSLLAWAKEEVFAFVLYYRQGTKPKDKEKVAIWTRELIDAVLAVGGTYYLPYQLHATQQQFEHGYPEYKKLFALKKKYDPENRFRNKLWQKYYEQKVQESIMTDPSSEFKSVYSDTAWRDKFYLFLQNIYHIYPEDKFHVLIKEFCEQGTNDQMIYQCIQEKLPQIKPLLAEVRYALPALFKQKKEMAKQTVELLGKNKTINGYVEIGSTGRYISELRKHLRIHEPIYLINDVAPSNSPVDIVERGQLAKLGIFVPLDHYQPLATASIPDASIDLVTCYVGLHHIPLDNLEPFVQSIRRVLRQGGSFIVRDHDVNTPEMRVFVSLVHSVFNAGLGISWEENNKELRFFTSIQKLIAMLEKNGFQDKGQRLLQENDPTRNTLIEFIKI